MFNDRWDAEYGGEFQDGRGSRWGLGPLIDAFTFASLSTGDWNHMRAEAEAESRARIAIAGLPGAGKSTLVNSLRGWTMSAAREPDYEAGLVREDLGLFLLLDLPAEGLAQESARNGWSDFRPGYDSESVTSLLADADMVLFLFDGGLMVESAQVDPEASPVSSDLRTIEYQWFCRIRALGRPLFALLNKVDLLAGDAAVQQQELERRLGFAVVALCAADGEEATARLLPALLDASPNLAMAIGRELPALRRRAAQRLIRRATLLSGLTGMQPLPLLDLPVQLSAQMRLLIRLSALFGQAKRSDGSRELLASVAGGMGLRVAVQQAAKLVPVLGWLASGLLSGLSTWLMGQSALAYFEGDLAGRMADFANLPAASRRRAERMAARFQGLRRSSRSARTDGPQPGGLALLARGEDRQSLSEGEGLS